MQNGQTVYLTHLLYKINEFMQLKHPLKKLLFTLSNSLHRQGFYYVYSNLRYSTCVYTYMCQDVLSPSSSGSSAFMMNTNLTAITLLTNIADLQQYKDDIISLHCMKLCSYWCSGGSNLNATLPGCTCPPAYKHKIKMLLSMHYFRAQIQVQFFRKW